VLNWDAGSVLEVVEYLIYNSVVAWCVDLSFALSWIGDLSGVWLNRSGGGCQGGSNSAPGQIRSPRLLAWASACLLGTKMKRAWIGICKDMPKQTQEHANPRAQIRASLDYRRAREGKYTERIRCRASPDSR
jgi:hypothetical protein